MKNNPVSRKDNIVVQEMKGEVLIYDLTENKAFCLNETSAVVWQACDGNRSIDEITDFVSKKLKSRATNDLVWFALDQLKEENLVEKSFEAPSHFAGLSRREVVRKVAFGTMIALPFIAGIIAPKSVMANSCAPLFGTCGSTADCCPGASLTCNSASLCCDGTGTIVTTGTVTNTVGNCGQGGAATRQAICDAACCSAAATGQVIDCTAQNLLCQCN